MVYEVFFKAQLNHTEASAEQSAYIKQLLERTVRRIMKYLALFPPIFSQLCNGFDWQPFLTLSLENEENEH